MDIKADIKLNINFNIQICPAKSVSKTPNMNEQKEKITAVQNAEEQAKLTKQLEEQVQERDEAILKLENDLYKSEQERVNLGSVLKKTESERDSWKNQAHASQKVQQNKEEIKKQNDFQTEFNKLQAKKGIQIETNE